MKMPKINLSAFKAVIIVLSLLAITVSAASSSHPTAKLEITEGNGFYTLDASQSFDPDDDIVNYKFDVDNDGTYDYSSTSSTYSRSFNTVPDTAKVKVEESNGNTSSAFADYDQADGYCKIYSGYIWIDNRRIKEGQSTDAYVNIYNKGDEQRVRVTFYDDGNQIDQVVKDVSGTEKFEISVSPDETSQISKKSDTIGAPCGDKQLATDSEKIYVENIEQKGTARMTVEDQDGNPVEDARVKINSNLKITGNDGTALFTLKPGSYNVEVTAEDYRTENTEIEISSNTRTSKTVDLLGYNGDAQLNVEVEDTDGNELENAEVKVSNSEEFEEDTDSEGEAGFTVEAGEYVVSVSKDGYRTESRNVDLESGETRNLRFELQEVQETDEEAILDVNVEDESGDELEDVRVRVENGDTKTRHTNIFGNAQFELEADTYDVRVSKNDYDTEVRTVTLDEGDFRTLDFNLERKDDPVDDARLEVQVEDEDGDELESARLRVENGDTETEFTDSDGEAVFNLEPDTYDVEVSKSGYRDEDRSITLDEGDDRVLRVELDEDRDIDDARLDVEVEDEDGDELESARVEVENGEREVEFTDNDGEARFYLEADEYDVEVSKNDYRTEVRDVDLDEGERETERFTLEETEGADLEIRNVRLSESTVCRGDSVYAYVDLTNHGEDDTFTVGADGLGSTVTKQVRIDEDEERTIELKNTNVRGSGFETLEVAVTNGDTKTFTNSVTVRDCGQQQPPGETATSTSLNVHPNEINAGESVKVTGFVDGTRGSQQVEIYLDGRKVADVSSARDGYFSTHVTPQSIGNIAVEARAGGRTASKSVRVLPNVYVGSVSAPDKVFESSEFQICADVQSQATPSVVLFRDGERIESKNGKGEVCFETQASEGEKEYKVLASAWSVQDSKTRTVEVLPAGTEVENFPDKLAMVRSGDGIVRVSLYNTGEDKRTYDVSVDGIPDDWFATSEREVVLTKGERENVYFYVTPEAEGDFVADVNVHRDGNRVHQSSIEISSGGTTTERKTWIEKITSLFANS